MTSEEKHRFFVELFGEISDEALKREYVLCLAEAGETDRSVTWIPQDRPDLRKLYEVIARLEQSVENMIVDELRYRGIDPAEALRKEAD